ncbi:DUF305 domain-containing protein [Nocardioides marmoraquaticus]
MAISGPAPHHPTLSVRRLRSRLAVLAVAGVVGLGVVGCGADDDPAEQPGAAQEQGQEQAREQDREQQSAGGGGPQVVQGGEPGEAAREVPSDTVAPRNEWSQDDATYMSMMIPHHAQALEMTELVPDRADDPRVVRLAERITASQAPEIQMMAAWLDERDLDVPRADDAHAGHGGHTMDGMLTDEQMQQLAETRGAAFDRLFLTSMIRHHEGALVMASETAGGGLDVIVGEHRDGLTSDQSTEVARMQELLADL